MENVFTYRPKLQYILEGINTIYRVLPENEREYIKDYIRYIDNNYIKDFEDAKKEFRDLIKIYREKVKNITVDLPGRFPLYITNSVDDINKYARMIANNQVSGEFIDQYKDSNFISEAKYQWNQINKSLKGSGVVEIYNVLKKVEYLTDLFDKCLDKTLYLWYNVDSSEEKADLFYKNYLLQIEDLVEENNNRRDSLEKFDDEGYKLSSERIATQERLLDGTSNTLYVISQLTNTLNSVTLDSYDMVGDNQNEEHAKSVVNRVRELKKDTNLNNNTIQSLLYNSYKKENKTLDKIDSKIENVLSENNMYNIINSYGRENKYYIEVLNDSLSTLKSKNTNKYGYTSSLIGGLEQIKEDYENSSVKMSSLVDVLKGYASSAIDTIYKKNDVRALYNSFTLDS